MVTDALSRAPVWPAPEDADILAYTARVAMARDKPMDESMDELARKAAEEEDYHAIYLALQAGKQPKDLPRTHPAQAAGAAWNNLSLKTELSGLICHMCQIWVPKGARLDLMSRIHASHDGETKTLALTRSLYYWPQMVMDLKAMVWACPQCEHYRGSKPCNQFLQTLDATYPWEHISADLAQYDGKHYLVVMDRYSGWQKIAQLWYLGTKAVTDQFEKPTEYLSVSGQTVDRSSGLSSENGAKNGAFSPYSQAHITHSPTAMQSRM